MTRSLQTLNVVLQLKWFYFRWVWCESDSHAAVCSSSSISPKMSIISLKSSFRRTQSQQKSVTLLQIVCVLALIKRLHCETHTGLTHEETSDRFTEERGSFFLWGKTHAVSLHYNTSETRETKRKKEQVSGTFSKVQKILFWKQQVDRICFWVK